MILPLLFLAGTASPGPVPNALLSADPAPLVKVTQGDITEAVQAAIDEFDKTFSAWVTKIRAAEGEEERDALFAVRPTADEAVKKLFPLIETEPASEGAFTGLKWIATRDPAAPEHAARALSLLAKHHVESEELKDIAMRATRGSIEMVPALGLIVKNSPHREVRGCAMLAMGILQVQDPESRKDGEKMLELVVAEYADVKVYGGRYEIGTMATGELYEARNLQIGMTVPEIEAEDIDGVDFKLSDYRGKVILLDFWGDW